MNELCAGNESLSCRLRCAIVLGLTSLSVIGGDWNGLDAAWWSFPAARKSADEATSKTNSGPTGTIRKLLKEAKAQEELGNLDKAIALADRAASVSEATSSFVKPAPDISPSTTARYARELRLKKTDQTVRRKDATPSGEKITQMDHAESVAKINNKEPTSPSPKKLVVTRGAEDFGDQRAATKMTVATSERRKSQAAAPTASQEFPSPGEASIAFPVAKSEAPAAKSDKPDPFLATSGAAWDDATPIAAHDPPQSIARRLESADESDKAKSIDRAEITQVVLTAPESTDGEVSPSSLTIGMRPLDGADSKEMNPLIPNPSSFQCAGVSPQSDLVPACRGRGEGALSATRGKPTYSQPIVDPRENPLTPTLSPQSRGEGDDRSAAAPLIIASPPLKLRRQYASNILEEFLGTVETVNTKSGADDEPASTELTTSSEEASTGESGTIVPVVAEVDPRSNWEHSKNLDVDSHPRKSKDVVRMRVNVAEEENRPEQEANDLKKRLRSAASLEPGAVAPDIIMASSANDAQWDRSNQEPATTRVIRVRKQRQPFREPVKQEPSATMTTQVRHPVVGHASVIQWRPAKEVAKVSTSESQTPRESRQARPSADLRTSLRDVSMTAFDASSTKRPMRGSSWNNAVAPASETASAINDNSATTNESVSRLAPLPPPDADVELTSFDLPGELVDRHKAQQLREETAIESTAALSGSNTDDPFLQALQRSVSEDDAALTSKKPAKDAIERLAKLLRISVSSMWTMLCAAGFAALISSLWMVRATCIPARRDSRS